MKVKIAKTSGFCWGVKRALDVVLKTAQGTSGRKVYTYGPLIHNEKVVQMLSDKDINPLTASDKQKGVVVVRAHGIPPSTQKQLTAKGYEVVDATCPHVKNSQKKVEDYARRKYQIIIAGDKKHAEVISLVGLVVSTKQEAVRVFKRVKRSSLGIRHSSFGTCLLAQSTFQPQEYEAIIEAIKKQTQRKTPRLSLRAPTSSRGAAISRPDNTVVVLNTICPAPTRRHGEVTEIARQVDAMVVVGDHKSANTTRLAGLAKTLGVPNYQVADETEQPLAEHKRYKSIGVTTGTSTPDWVTQAVIKRLSKL
ncbi:MAG: 4-hydroxy-3-methylbut-2-enyl diphosphate reductase [Planctomycetes bacterium]|nr:4-hydroxy-3-methylbut-2-enyl diphosphate reductase [Planctomycetota bacterium]